MVKYLSRTWFCCAVIGLFTLLVWGTTIGFDFVWDDSVLVVQNQSIRSLKNLPAIFTSVKAQSAEIVPSFRPLRTAFYALLYFIDGHAEPRPWIFHLANILWHAAAAMLLFSVARLIWQKLNGGETLAGRLMALLVALGFAAHPALSEDVCWVKCLDDLMAAVFVLAALRSLLKWRGGARGYVAAVIYCLLACLAKESAVPLAVLVFFVFTGFHRLPWRRSALLTAPFLVTAMVYVGYRHLVLGQTEQCPPLSGSYGQTLLNMFPTVPKYFRLLWGIPPFSIDYDFMLGKAPHPFFSGEVLGGAGIILAFVGLAIWWWRRESWRMASFGIVWLALFLLPVANLIPMTQYMAERFLYLPLMGFLLAVGTIGLHVRRARWAVMGAVWLTVIWTMASAQRLGIWQDEVTLFTQTALAYPDNPRARENAALAVFALPQILPFFKLDPVTREVITLQASHGAQAAAVLQTLQGAQRLFPAEHRYTSALGITYGEQGQFGNAIGWLTQATRQKTNDVHAWIDLGTAYLMQTNFVQARAAWETALRLSPANEVVRRRLAQLPSK